MSEVSKSTRLITHKEVIGWMAHWAVRQHPFGRPEGLFDVTDTIAAEAGKWPEGIASLRMWRVSESSEIRRWLHEIFGSDHPVMLAWNTARSGREGNISVSRYDDPRPEDDFIDIDALLGNVAMSVWREAEE